MLTWVRAAAAVLMVVASLGGEALACGDKFLVPGRRARFRDQLVARASAAVLIYVPPGSVLDGTPQGASLVARLQEAGYRPTLVTSEPGLELAMRGGAWDVVIADLADGPGIARQVSNGPAPTVLPVAHAVGGAALDQAKRLYPQVLGSRSSDRDLFRAIDAILAQRTRARATPAGKIGG